MADFLVRRIVIACDAASDNHIAIGTAARLAALLNAALHGVFVEDSRLEDLIGLPFARHVEAWPSASAAATDLGPASAALHMAAVAEQVRKALQQAAAHHNIAWSFATVRDDPARAARRVDPDAKLIAGASARPFAGHWRADSPWLDAALRMERTALLVRRGVNQRGRVVALVRSDAASARRAVAAAAALAAKTKRPLGLLLAAEAPPTNEVRAWAEAADPTLAAHSGVERMGAGPAAALRAIAGHAHDLLVLDADPDAIGLEALRDLVVATEANVLLVR